MSAAEESEFIIKCEQQFEDVERTDLYNYLVSGWSEHPDDVVVVNTSDEREITCRQLSAVIERTSRDLAAAGVRRGSMVSVWCPNCAEILIVVMATWKLRAAVAMIGPSLTAEEAGRQILKVRSNFLFADQKHVKATIHKMFNQQTPKTVFSLNGKQLLVLPSPSTPVTTPFNPCSDTCLILFSSGTTGYPKAVELTHSNMVVSLHCSGPKVTGRTTPPTIHYLPLSHFYGISLAASSLRDISTIYILERFHLEDFIQLIPKYQVPVLFLVPPVAVMMTKRPDLMKKYDMSSVLAVFSSAAALSPGIERELRDMLPSLIFTKFRQGYGMTETTGAVVRTPIILGGKDPTGSVGKAVPTCEIKIVDEETGRSLGPNKHGEIVVRGPLVMKGYFDDPQATANIIDSNGWLYTGDIGYYDDGGYLFVVDRAKELIKCRGNQVAPAELEDILLTHPDVIDTAVVGLPNELAGELPLAFVVRRPNSTVTERQLQDYVAGQVARYKQLVGGVRFIDEIPKVASGKILRRQLRDKLRTAHKL